MSSSRDCDELPNLRADPARSPGPGQTRVPASSIDEVSADAGVGISVGGGDMLAPFDYTTNQRGFPMRQMSGWTIVTVLLAGLCVGVPMAALAAEAAVVLPAPLLDNSKAPGPPQTAVIAGGCFWGVQGVFQHVRGVQSVLSGYAGGTKATAHYDVVSRGGTGHAESVEIRFDPKELSYGEVLQIFFSVVHDPTQLNRQGPDTGTQYRSNVFYVDDTQKRIAQAYIAQMERSKLFGGAIVTRVDPLDAFYPAEAYHQDFLLKNPTSPYIVINDLPKIENLKRVFSARYRERPVLVEKSN
jgi:peptide-methionine (S)-S-oxide reductase